MVQIGTSRFDLAETNCKNITLMVAEEKTFKIAPFYGLLYK